MDEVVYTVCSKVKIADDFLFFIAFIIILRLTVLRGLKYFFQNQKCEDSTYKYEILTKVSLLFKTVRMHL